MLVGSRSPTEAGGKFIGRENSQCQLKALSSRLVNYHSTTVAIQDELLL